MKKVHKILVYIIEYIDRENTVTVG